VLEANYGDLNAETTLPLRECVATLIAGQYGAGEFKVTVNVELETPFGKAST
jgi:hypothetical protein